MGGNDLAYEDDVVTTGQLFILLFLWIKQGLFLSFSFYLYFFPLSPISVSPCLKMTCIS